MKLRTILAFSVGYAFSHYQVGAEFWAPLSYRYQLLAIAVFLVATRLFVIGENRLGYSASEPPRNA